MTGALADRSDVATTGPTSAPYIRLATPADLDALAELATVAFINDALLHSFGGLDSPLVDDPELPARRAFRAFQDYTNRECFEADGRTTVLVAPPSSPGQTEEIVAMTIFLPPGKRMAGTLEAGMRTRIMDVVEGWGHSWMRRLDAFFESGTQAFADAFAAKGVQEGALDVWYLQVACVHPRYHRKGYLTRLMREMYAFAPNSIMTLDSSSARSRSAYETLGFEVARHWKAGVGRVDENGLLADGEEAKGVSVYSMVKWADRS